MTLSCFANQTTVITIKLETQTTLLTIIIEISSLFNKRLFTLFLHHKKIQQKMSDFRCKYCSRTFSRRGAFRNHLKIHRDQMYLEENELTRENVSNSEINSVTIKNTLQKTITLADEIIYDEISLDINDANIMNVDFYEVKFN